MRLHLLDWSSWQECASFVGAVWRGVCVCLHTNCVRPWPLQAMAIPVGTPCTLAGLERHACGSAGYLQVPPTLVVPDPIATALADCSALSNKVSWYVGTVSSCHVCCISRLLCSCVALHPICLPGCSVKARRQGISFTCALSKVYSTAVLVAAASLWLQSR